MGRHAPNVDASIVRQVRHSDPVAQNGAARIGTRRVDRDDSDLHVGGPEPSRQRRDKRGFSAARHARDPDDVRPTRALIDLQKRRPRLSHVFLNPGDQTGDGWNVATLGARDKLIRRHEGGHD
jgi:hypothetical protein